MQLSSPHNYVIRGETAIGGSARIFSGTALVYDTSSPANATAIYIDETSPWSTLTRFLFVTIGLFILALIATPLYSNSATMAEPSAIARIGGGVVNILRADSGTIEKLDDGAQIGLQIHDMLSTESGKAMVQFFTSQFVSVSPNARLTIERYENSDMGKRLEYMVWAGHILHESRQPAGTHDWIQISTPSSNVSIRNAVISVDVISAGETIYWVTEGVAWVTMGEQEIVLTSNERLVAAAEQPLINRAAGANSTELTADSNASNVTASQPFPSQSASTVPESHGE